MTNPQQETKIELVTEAIETLVLAQVVALTPGHNTVSGPLAHEQVLQARRLLHDALGELLTPVLRVVTTHARVGEMEKTRTVVTGAREVVIEAPERVQRPGGIDDLPCSKA